MSDRVQLIIENMIPELNIYVKIGIFTKLQIKKIIKKRRDHEFNLLKKDVSINDYKKAIKYEKLLLIRKEKIRKSKNISKKDLLNSHCKYNN